MPQPRLVAGGDQRFFIKGMIITAGVLKQPGQGGSIATWPGSQLPTLKWWIAGDPHMLSDCGGDSRRNILIKFVLLWCPLGIMPSGENFWKLCEFTVKGVLVMSQAVRGIV